MNIIDKCKKGDHFFRLDDGFMYFFPDRKGGISASQLREIADHLDKENEEITKSIEEFFKEAGI